MRKDLIFVCDVTYSGMQRITPVKVEYQHTGEIHELIKRGKVIKYTFSKEISEEWKVKGHKVQSNVGHYYIKRLAIPSIKDDGTKTWWYINNDGDSYVINRVSKYGRRIHAELSKTQNP